jgi:putative nucleotidyltransferase with HDIG domain
MIVAIVFDSRTAFYTTVTMALMLSGIRGNDYNTGVALLFAGTLAAYTVRDIQSRTQMFQSIFYIFIGSVFPILMIGLERSIEFNILAYKIVVATMNSILSPVITFGLLIPLEKWTSITTDLKLEEYDKVNHPLLVKLSEIAPGTYQHTLAVVNLVERCAIAINANPLLAKVGAYFHDIGKIAKPEYFAENQVEMENKHDLLTPKKSADAIRQHVINGIKLAHDYKIPQIIIDFIPMHHGTSLIKHFYAKAIEGSEKDQINEDDFRYPGPKPFTKETAIVMICDSAEAMSRLVPKTKEDLDKMLSGIIRDKINDGQFDDCNITMNDFQIIKDTCIKSLLGASHQRVKYLDLPEEKKE